MSAAEEVPLTRELLEALRDFAVQTARMGSSLALGARQHGEKEALGNFNRATSAAATLKDACAAALASDAGTPVGERDCDGWRQSVFDQFRRLHGHHEGCCIRQFTDWLANGGGPTKPEPPPTNAPEISTSLVDAAPGPEGPVAQGDAELDRLLADFGALMWDRGRGRGTVPLDIPQTRAIHAHVEQVKREARAGRMRDMDVPTLHKVPKPEPVTARDASGEIGDLLDRMLAAHGAALSPTSISREERCAHGDHRDALKDEVLRLYRAATGEVVGTGRLHRTRPSGVNHGCELVSFEFAAGVEMAHGGRYAVTLVLRRDKEGV